MLQCYSKNATVLQKNVGFFTENHNYWDIWTQMSSFKCGTGILKLPRKKKLGTELGKRILNSIDRAYEEHCIYSIEIHIFHSNSVSIKTQNTLSIEIWTRLNSVELGWTQCSKSLYIFHRKYFQFWKYWNSGNSANQNSGNFANRNSVNPANRNLNSIDRVY